MEKELPRESPQNLYEPVRYIMGLGGKRIRPLLALWACEAGGQPQEKALPVAMAVEAFHNFSLIHDDIMDEAPMRRGQASVHQKWNNNIGILSGDVLLVCAYQYLAAYEDTIFKQLTQTFSATARWVCEGQQLDMDFPQQSIVSLSNYLEMIEKKTAVLLGASLKMGAIAGGMSLSACESFFEYGKNIGIAFQLQDDFLDAFGDPKTFGKQLGGDIIENKKTFLYLYASTQLKGAEKESLEAHYRSQPKDALKKIEAVKALFEKADAIKAIKNEMETYLDRAFEALNTMNLADNHKQRFSELAHYLVQREI